MRTLLILSVALFLATTLHAAPKYWCENSPGFQRLLKNCRASERIVINQMRNELDVNKDGKITKKEFEAYREQLENKPPQAPSPATFKVARQILKEMSQQTHNRYAGIQEMSTQKILDYLGRSICRLHILARNDYSVILRSRIVTGKTLYYEDNTIRLCMLRKPRTEAHRLMFLRLLELSGIRYTEAKSKNLVLAIRPPKPIFNFPGIGTFKPAPKYWLPTKTRRTISW